MASDESATYCGIHSDFFEGCDPAEGLNHLLNFACQIRDRDYETNCFLLEDDRWGRISIEWKRVSASSSAVLRGLGLGVKDLYRADGLPTRAGSSLPPSVFEGPEARSVSLLKAAGTVVIGKTVTTEFAYFEPGPTRNPLDHARTPGGSSSGSAAAVSAGFCDVALGTQTIGSIIRPASYCGISGFKPTWGLVPLDGVVPFSPSADHAGIFARDIRIIAAAMTVLSGGCIPADLFESRCFTTAERRIFAGKAPKADGTTTVLSSGNPAKPVIGLVTGELARLTGVAAAGVVESAARILKTRGYKVLLADPFPDFSSVRSLHQDLVAREFAEVHEEWFARFHYLYRAGSKGLIEKGRRVADSRLEEAKASMGVKRRRVEELMNARGIDIWLSASTVGTASLGIRATGDPVMNLPWTHTGQPAITIPFGVDAAGLPFGLQFSGTFGGDADLLLWVDGIAMDLRAPNERLKCDIWQGREGINPFSSKNRP